MPLHTGRRDRAEHSDLVGGLRFKAVYAAARAGWNEAGKDQLMEKMMERQRRIDVQIEPARNRLSAAIAILSEARCQAGCAKKTQRTRSAGQPPIQENEPMPDLMLRSSHERRNFSHEYKRRSEVTRQFLDEQNSKRDLDRRLDLALEETFPASDPVSIMIAS